MGLVLAALGVEETIYLNWACQYQQALAQPTQRKLALLIGINQYPESTVDPTVAQDVALRGCLTDVELQRELLIYRFGFNPADIVTLTDQAATKQNIQDAIADHLIHQAQPGDGVVLHFSGYGSQVRLAHQPETLQLSLVPMDGWVPTEEHPEIRDILEAELLAQLRSLKTTQITTVLDVGYRDLGQLRWGTLRMRSRPTVPTGTLPESIPESALETLRSQDPSINWPGILLRASTRDRLALEGEWSGFSAGMLTQVLTQTLWEMAPSAALPRVWHQVSDRLQTYTGPDQQPELTGKHPMETTLRAYHLPPMRPAADGVITGIHPDNQTVSLWLGGLPAPILESLQTNSRIILASPNRDPGSAVGLAEPLATPSPATPVLATPLPTSRFVTEFTLQSRSGLNAAAKVAQAPGSLPQVGQAIYEWVRGLPKNMALVVALDTDLERIERVDATSALSSIPFVASTLAGEQRADCLFGRLPQFPAAMTLAAKLPQAHPNEEAVPLLPKRANKGVERSYGLFAPNRTLVPGTLIPKAEAVKTAINRLTPHLQTLLAMKLLRLTENLRSSQLAVRLSLAATYPREQLLMQWETLRSPTPLPKSRAVSSSLPLKIAPESRLRYRVHNYGDRDLYVTLLSFDSRGDLLALAPAMPQSQPLEREQDLLYQSAVLGPGQARFLPGETLDWGLPSGAIWIETYVVFSTAPFLNTWEALAQEAIEVTGQADLRRVTQPLKVVRAVLSDLHRAATAYDPRLESNENFSLHVATWGTVGCRFPLPEAGNVAT